MTIINMDEFKIWFKKAKKDLKAARHSLASGDYDWASFQAHQSVEKALKSIYIKKTKQLIKIHDLSQLAKKINAPRDIVILCNEINPVYIDTRYPDIPKEYNKKDAKLLINKAEEVLRWIGKNL